MDYALNPQTPALISSGEGAGAGDIPFRINSEGRINVLSHRPFLDDDGNAQIVVNSSGQTEQLHTNDAALLQYQEWLDIDRTVIEVARERLVGIADLQANGLVYNLGSIGQTVTLWDRVSDMTPANINMSGITPGQEDTPAFATQQVPVPIIHKDFRLNIRRLVASRQFGSSLDTTAATIASALVSEASERMLFNGTPISVEDGTIYGYRNFPARTQLDLTTVWTDASPEDIKADVQAMLASARANRFYGNFTLYIPAKYEGVLDDDYWVGDDSAGMAAPNRTIRDALLSLSGLENIRVADLLGDEDEVILVPMDRRTVDLAMAQDITTVSWQAMGGMQERFKVMAVWVPRLKSDYDGRSGIVHLRPA